MSDGSGGFNWGKPDYDLNDLDDVTAATPADNDILVFSASSTAWISRPVSGDVSFASGSMTLNDNTVEESNLKISGTAVSGSIVLSNGAGALKWGPQITTDDLGDLSVSDAESGHILVYKDSTSGFVNVGASGDVTISASGSTSINDNAIDAGNLRGASAALGNGADGQLLAATGTSSRFKWITNTVASVDFGGVSSPRGGDALLYDSANSRWKNVPLSGDVTVDSSGVVGIASGAIKMTSLSGITGDGTANTSFVVSDGSGGFNLASSVATGDVDSLSDVTITGTASGGQIFMRGASAWGNVALTGDATMNASGQITIGDNRVGIAELKVTGTASEGDFLASDGDGGLKWLENSIGKLSDLSDVSSGAVTAGSVLARGSSEWSGVSLSGDVTATVSGGNLVVTLGNDSVEAANIKATGSASSGAVLYSDGSGGLAWNQPRVWENDDFTGASGARHYGPLEVADNKGKKIEEAKKIHINMHGVRSSDASSNLIIQMGSDETNTRAVSTAASSYSGHVRVGTGTGATTTSFSTGFVIPFPSTASGVSTFSGVAELNLMSKADNGNEKWHYTIEGFSVDSPQDPATPVVSPHYGTGVKKITSASGLQNIKVSSVSGNVATGDISILYG